VLLVAPAPFAADVALSRLAERLRSLRSLRGAVFGASLTPLEGARGASDEKEKGWVAARVSDPRRDPASVKADVARFAASHEDVDALRRCRVVSCSCASAGLVADALEARARAEAREKGPGGNAGGDPGGLSRRDGKTFSSSFSPLDFFTHVFFDEAGQATVPEALVPLARLASVKTRAFVLAGDPRQLGPTVHSAASAREGLGVSPLENFPGGFSRTVRLVENYRSHADVLDLPSRLFYDASLVARATSEVTRLPASLVDRREPEHEPGDASKAGSESDDGGRPARVLFYGVRGAQTREGDGEAPSYFNAPEARALVELLASWLARGGGAGGEDDVLRASDVGVIAPYRAQVIRLRRLLRARGLGAVRVGTVDDYQGQEERVVFISSVLTRAPTDEERRDENENETAAGKPPEASARTRHHGFLACPRRFNVAVSRAKALNVVVGHPAALATWPHWRALLKHCIARGAYVGAGAESIPAVGAGVGGPGGEALFEHAAEAGEGAGGEEGEGRFGAAVARLAAASLLGGGEEMDGGGGGPGYGESAFQDEQAWRVAL
jgi:putative helicase MOV10L1